MLWKCHCPMHQLDSICPTLIFYWFYGESKTREKPRFTQIHAFDTQESLETVIMRESHAYNKKRQIYMWDKSTKYHHGLY